MTKTTKKEALETRLSHKILGRLVCFDRIVVNGTLQRLQNPAAIAGMLHDRGLDAFELKEFVLPLTSSVRDNAKALAETNGLKIEFVADRRLRKEDIAREYLAVRGSEEPGLVCVLSAIENCSSFAPRKAGGKQGLKTYNKGSVLRVENSSADITFYRHYRKVEKRDGTSEMKTAPLRKQVGSLSDLFKLMSRGCERYLEQLGLLEDPEVGREDLDKLTRPERDEKGRSWRGVNLFLRADLDLATALFQGAGCLRGFTNKLLRGWLGGTYNSGQVSRMLRRLREHGLVKKVSKTFRYYLTERGKRMLMAALKIREHLVIPALQPGV